MLVSELFPSLRIALHDEGLVDGIFEYSEGMLRGLIQSVFLMGEVPCSLELEGEDETLAITPDPTGPAAGIIVMEAALQWLGSIQASSYKTRALSVTQSAGAVRDVISNLRLRKEDLMQAGNLCGDGKGPAGFGIRHEVCTYTWHACQRLWPGFTPQQVISGLIC